MFDAESERTAIREGLENVIRAARLVSSRGDDFSHRNLLTFWWHWMTRRHSWRPGYNPLIRLLGDYETCVCGARHAKPIAHEGTWNEINIDRLRDD